jgi:Zn-finger protein
LRDDTPRQYKQGQFSSKDNINKTCGSCLKLRSLEMFYKNKRYKDGYVNNCKDCHLSKSKKHYKDVYHDVMKERLKTDVLYKLKQNVKSYIHIQLKNKDKIKTKNTNKYLGCDIDFFYGWLLYNNADYNSNEYHMDHVIPLNSFDLSREEDIDIAFNWTNIQVLKKHENLKKSSKIDKISYFNHIIKCHRFILSKTKNYKFLKQNLKYFKTKIFATLPNCGDTLRA